jgi:hypothetical protein
MQTIQMPPTRFPAFQDDLDTPEPEDGSHIDLDSGDLTDLSGASDRGAAPIAIVDTTHDRINITVETVAAAAALYTPEEAALVIWSHKYALDHKWSLSVAQRQYRLHSTVLSRVWQGKYRQPPNIRPPGAPKTGKVHRLIPNPVAGQLLPLAGFCKRIASYKEVADARGSETRLPSPISSPAWPLQLPCRRPADTLRDPLFLRANLCQSPLFGPVSSKPRVLTQSL